MFPDRWPGAGLLLLRLACGAVLMIQGAAFFDEKGHPGFFIFVLVSLMSAVGLLLVIGFLTRYVALVGVLASVACASSWLPGSGYGPLAIPMTAALSTVIALAVTCMGPGAMSLDARLFGRREIIIPANSLTSR